MPVTEGAPAHGAVSHLLPQSYKRTIASWLEEDAPSFDYGGFVVGEELAEARLLGKSKVGAFPYFFILTKGSSWTLVSCCSVFPLELAVARRVIVSQRQA